jgi:ABC-type sugar transport system permease subunit
MHGHRIREAERLVTLPELSSEEVAFSRKRDLARNVLPPGRVGAILLFPTLLILVALAIYPTFYAVWQSLRIELIYNSAASRFVGLETFANLFADPFAVKSLRLTALWSAMVLLVQMPLGIAIAMLLDRDIRGQAFCARSSFCPSSFRRSRWG